MVVRRGVGWKGRWASRFAGVLRRSQSPIRLTSRSGFREETHQSLLLHTEVIRKHFQLIPHTNLWNTKRVTKKMKICPQLKVPKHFNSEES